MRAWPLARVHPSAYEPAMVVWEGAFSTTQSRTALIICQCDAPQALGNPRNADPTAVKLLKLMKLMQSCRLGYSALALQGMVAAALRNSAARCMELPHHRDGTRNPGFWVHHFGLHTVSAPRLYTQPFYIPA
jgi:hypothetical protein